MHTISPIVTWPSWSDLALYTEYIIFWAALPSPCSDYISCIILKPFLQSFGLCFSNFGSLVIVQITHFLFLPHFTSPLWQLFILWHVFSPSHFGSFILWDVFSPDCDSCLLWHAFYSWMGFGFFMRLLFTFLLRHSSFCGMYLILVTAFCGMCSVHESACAFLCGLHTAFTFLLWQLFIMWHMFSSSVCDNSLCDMFSYCDSSSNGMCSADLIATNHRPDKLSTSCWSVVRGNKGSVKCSYANGSGKFQKYWLATFVTPNYRTAAATYAQLTVTITPSSVKCMEVKCLITSLTYTKSEIHICIQI